MEFKISAPTGGLLTAIFILASFLLLGACAHDEGARNFWENMENRGVGKL